MTVLACYLGWTLDAFDYFIVVFVLDDVARALHASIRAVAWSLTLTLACRPLGALAFGRAADRFGRRPVLIASILAYSAIEFASAAAPDLAAFLLLRAAFGVALGGEWGVGAALTMETIPPRWRGAVSGLLQTGYPTGYLLASLLFLAEPALGWRGMFAVGALPAALVLLVWNSVAESPDWLARRRRAPAAAAPARWRAGLLAHLPIAAFAVLGMAAFNCFSHGSQDLYPKLFLDRQLGFGRDTVTAIVVAYNVGAIAGGLCFGALSQRIGRGRAIALAALLSLPVLPFFAFGATPVRIAIAAVLMQFCIQGAWGVVPAWLNELSPPAARATFPGLTYQLGNLLASPVSLLELAIARVGGGGLGPAFALVLGPVALLLAALGLLGPRRSSLDPPPPDGGEPR